MAAAAAPPGRSGPGAAVASSRLPVRGARVKRPAAGPEAAAVAVPEQKRARPGGGGGRAPLRALSLAAAARPAAPPRKATSTVAPRAGAPPAGAAPKRPPWDLRGQVSDLRAALGGARQREQELERQLGTVGEELAALRVELGRRQEEEERQRRARAEAEGRAQELAQALRHTQAQLSQSQAAAEAQSQLVAQLQAQVATGDQRLARQDQQLQALELERRRLHNQLQELKGNIRVFCRVRPLLPQEEARQKGLEHLRFPPGDGRTLVLCRPEEAGRGRGDGRYDFTFDRVFPPSASQQDVFEEVAQLVQSALDGYHVCIFAYGQTGSGKTYTMEGPPGGGDAASSGLIPRAVGQLFRGARELREKGWEYEFSASFLEIYNEGLRDLLGGPGRGELEIRRVSAASAELHVPNLRRVPVGDEEEVLALLRAAGAQRAVAATAQNERSSRSHSVCQLRLRGGHRGRDLRCDAVLSLVDLAGSERLDKSLSRGERLREAQAINTSLSTLALVITAISNKEPHVPYRNSKLTYLLQNSLGGAAKMLMIVNVSPLEENFPETLNSLRFASKVNECVVGTARANRK